MGWLVSERGRGEDGRTDKQGRPGGEKKGGGRGERERKGEGCKLIFNGQSTMLAVLHKTTEGSCRDGGGGGRRERERGGSERERERKREREEERERETVRQRNRERE